MAPSSAALSVLQGCTARMKLVYNIASKITGVYFGWSHKHQGTFNGKRGLPPQVKTAITTILKNQPNIKLRFEQRFEV